MVSTSILACALMLGLFGFGPPGTPSTQAGPGQVRWVVSDEGSEARYLVREQLAGFDFPNDAIGATSALSGQLVLEDDGTIVAEQSEFRVDLTTLKTDNDRRDGYVQRRTLETEQFPEAVLVPTEFRGLPSPLPSTGTVSFQLAGELTLHGVTRSTLWEVTANFTSEKITGQAKTAFTFETFGIPVPSVARVLSVADDIRLEFDFVLAPAGG